MTVASRTRVVALFLLLGVVLRLGVHAVVAYRVDTGDAAGYLQAGHNLVEHHTFSEEAGPTPQPTVYRPPLYASFVGAGLLLHDSVNTVRSLQILLSLASGLLAALLAWRHSEAAGALTFGVMMLSPFEAVYSGALLSETLTAFIMLAAAALLVLGKAWWRWPLAGAIAGLLALCRDIYLPLPPLVAVSWVLFGGGELRRRVREATLLVVAMGLVILPWTLRNRAVSGALVPVSAGRLGFSLWLGSWAVDGSFTAFDSTGERKYPDEAFRSEAEKLEATEALRPTADRKTADATLKRLAFERMRAEPGAVVVRWVRRIPLLWLGTRFDIFELRTDLFPAGSLQWRAAKSLLWGLNFLLIALGVCGLVVVVLKRTVATWLALPVLFTAAIYLPLNGFENRYSQPVYPFVLILGAVALSSLKTALAARAATHVETTAANQP